MEGPRFRRAYVVEPGHDFTALLKHASELVFLTTGYERLSTEERQRQIRERLVDFEPTTDVIVPAGKAISSLLTGAEAARFGVFYAAFYKGHDYEFVVVTVKED